MDVVRNGRNILSCVRLNGYREGFCGLGQNFIGINMKQSLNVIKKQKQKTYLSSGIELIGLVLREDLEELY